MFQNEPKPDKIDFKTTLWIMASAKSARSKSMWIYPVISYTYIYIHTHANTYTHTQTRIHMYTYTHIYLRVKKRKTCITTPSKRKLFKYL